MFFIGFSLVLKCHEAGFFRLFSTSPAGKGKLSDPFLIYTIIQGGRIGIVVYHDYAGDLLYAADHSHDGVVGLEDDSGFSGKKWEAFIIIAPCDKEICRHGRA